MKKNILIVFFLLISVINYADIGKYEKIKLLDTQVYFPKNIQDYLEYLRLKDDSNTYYKIAKIYERLGKEEAAIYFLDEYAKYSKEFFKIADLYNVLGEYEKEIEQYKKYSKDKDIKTRIEIYNKIENIIKEKKLNKDLNIKKVSKLEILFSKTNEEEFYKYFKENSWSNQELENIVEKLSEENLRGKQKKIEIFVSNADKTRIIKYFYDNIIDITDKEGYFNYFDILYVYEEPFIWKTKVEELYYLDYLEEENSFSKLQNEIIKSALDENEFRQMYILYKTYDDFKIVYNLVLEDSKYLVDLIKFVNKDSRKKYLLDEYEKIVGKIDYNNEELFDLKLKYSEIEQKIALIDEKLDEQFNRKYFLLKLDLLIESGKKEEALTILDNYIFNIYEDDKFIEIYLELANEILSKDDIYNKLQKLIDKNYFYDYCARNDYKVPKEYEMEAIKYFIDNGYYETLYQYRYLLDYEQLLKLIKLGKFEFYDAAQELYPTEEIWRSDKGIKYFYFNDDYSKFSKDEIEEIENMDTNTPAEIFYLAKYYNYIEDYKRSQDYLVKLEDRYAYAKNMLELYIENRKNIPIQEKQEEKERLEKQKLEKEKVEEEVLDESNNEEKDEKKKTVEKIEEKKIIEAPEIEYFELEEEVEIPLY